MAPDLSEKLGNFLDYAFLPRIINSYTRNAFLNASRFASDTFIL